MMVENVRELIPVRLREQLAQIASDGDINIAYSGGLDSRFLAFCSMKLSFRVQLLTVSGPHIDPDDTKQALAYARDWGLPVTTLFFDPLRDAEIQQAADKRCYVCKKRMFAGMISKVVPGILCDGTNASDQTVYRPGRLALKELGVRSPLLDAGVDKSAIRSLAHTLGMPEADQAARPCLLTRFPYGMQLTAQQLQLVAAGERFVRMSPWGKGLRFRLRFPDMSTPVLHWDVASVRPLTGAQVEDLRRELIKAFPDALSGLRIEAVQTLSGFYDRPNSRVPSLAET